MRIDIGATYGMTDQSANYSRSQWVLVISGEIDGRKMAEVRAAVLAADGEFIANPDTALLGEVKPRFAEGFRREQVFVSSYANMIRELVLDNRGPQEYHTLPDAIEAMTDEILRERLNTGFPKQHELAIFGAGADPSVFPDACVVTEPAQAARCW